MKDRGEYRPIYTAIVDGPDFQALSPVARLLFFVVKLSLPATGIGAVPGMVGALAERSGHDEAQVERGLDELAQGGWLARERNVVWLIRGLEFEPSMSPANPKHRTFLRREIGGLPKLGIVARFRAHYAAWFADESKATPAPVEAASDRVSDTLSHTDSEGSRNGKANPMPITSTSTTTETTTKEKPVGAKQPRRVRPPREKRESDTALSWVARFGEAWRPRGEPPFGRIGKVLKPIVDEHGEYQVWLAWDGYLGELEGKPYASPEHFAANYTLYRSKWAVIVDHDGSPIGVPDGAPDGWLPEPAEVM